MFNSVYQKRRFLLILIATAFFLLPGCGTSDSSGESGGSGGQLKVVATTTILGDVVSQVGGEAIDLTVLLPAGIDPHTFQPAPQDLTALSQAGLIFINGAGLETSLSDFLENARGQHQIVSASQNIDLHQLEGARAEDSDHDELADDEVDPHVWFDPNNVIVWTQDIEQGLSELDPGNAQVYRTNAEAYRVKLQELHAWINQQVAQIPADNRKLVTDHQVFGYFAERYGFEQIGAVIPSFSTGAEPSAQQIAALEDKIREFNVPAIFVGETVNPDLAEQIASDTGVQLIPLYTGSLTEPGGEADSYIALMRYDVAAIVRGLTN